MTSVHDFLAALGLERYAQAFEDNDIDPDLLPELTAEDLKDIGVASLGHRKRILAAIAEQSRRAAAMPAPGATDAARPDDAPAVAAGAERREVTTLFADLTGYTALSRALEPEDMHALLSSFFGRLDEIVKRMGGTVDSHIGDCVMAVFGAPVSRGDDAERALRAAVEMHLAMEEISLEFGRTLSVHIGVAAGNVIFSTKGQGSQRDTAFTLTGDSVNVASRLAGLATGGETLISATVHNALGDRISCDPPEYSRVKGLDEAVETHRFKGFEERPPERPLIGRTDELAALCAALDDCRRNARGETVALVADPGVGKSHLAGAVAREAEGRGFARHKALVLDFGLSAANDPLRTLAASLCGLAERAEPSAVAAALERLTAAGDLDERDAMFLMAVLGAPLDPGTERVYNAMSDEARAQGRRRGISRLLRGRAAAAPLLLLVEDVHWADAETRAKLADIAADAAQAPIVLLLTARVEGDPFGPDWHELIGEAPFRRIELAPLSQDDAFELAKALYAPSDAVVRECVARAGGNPLFLDQLLRHAHEQGPSAVPGSIQSIIQARLDRLSLVDRRALQAAAILGQRFTMEEVAAVGAFEVYDERPLRAAGLIQPIRQSYLFAHALIRDAVLQMMLRDDRLQMHRRAADWFLERDAVLHAEHLAAAQAPEAAAAFLRAGTEARAAYRKEAALGLAQRGLQQRGEASVRGALLRLQGDMQRDLGRAQEAMESFGAALEVAVEPSDRCRARIGTVAVLRIMDRIDEAYALLDEAEDIAAANDLALELSEIHYFRGSLHFPRGNLERCLEEHGRSLHHAERCDHPERRALALSGLGDAHYARGRMFTAHEVIEECLTLATDHGLGAVEAANRFMLATVRIYMNDTERALDDAQASVRLAGQVGHARAEIVSRLTAGWILASMAEVAAARREVTEGLAVADRLGARRFEPFLEESRARIELAEGDCRRAAATAEAALAKLRELDAMSFIGPWVLATVALTTADAARRAEALAEGEALLARGCVGHNHYRFRCYAIDACLAAGEHGEARRHADALQAYTAEEPTPWSDFIIARAHALSDAAEGRGDAERLGALRATAEAARLHASIPGIHTALAGSDRARPAQAAAAGRAASA